MTSATTAVLGFVFGGIFLLFAVVSTVSKVTLVVFNPWLLRQVRYRDQPRAFIVIVSIYWVLGGVGISVAIAAIAEGLL
jgi:hypothetical protein